MIENLSTRKWTETQKEVWETVLTYTNLIIEDKKDEFLEYIHENYSGWNNIEPLPADKQSIVSELNSETLHTSRGSYSLIPIKLNIHNTIAVVHYYLKNEFKGNENSTNLIIKNYTDILINNGTRWVLIADHFGVHKKRKIDNHNQLEDY